VFFLYYYFKIFTYIALIVIIIIIITFIYEIIYAFLSLSLIIMWNTTISNYTLVTLPVKSLNQMILISISLRDSFKFKGRLNHQKKFFLNRNSRVYSPTKCAMVFRMLTPYAVCLIYFLRSSDSNLSMCLIPKI